MHCAHSPEFVVSTILKKWCQRFWISYVNFHKLSDCGDSVIDVYAGKRWFKRYEFFKVEKALVFQKYFLQYKRHHPKVRECFCLIGR